MRTQNGPIFFAFLPSLPLSFVPALLTPQTNSRVDQKRRCEAAAKPNLNLAARSISTEVGVSYRWNYVDCVVYV